MTSLAALAAASRLRMSWAANSDASGNGTALWGTPSGALTNGAGYVPFDVATATGDVPTSYTFNGLSVSPLPGDAAILGLELLGYTVRHRVALLDLLWISAGYTAASAATVDSPILPARDLNGSTAGEGCVLVGWFGAGMNATVSYTNSDGDAGRSTTLPASTIGGPWIFPLQSGDKGVRSVQTITPSSTSLCRFAIVRRVAAVNTKYGLAGNGLPDDAVTSQLHNVTTLKSGTLLFPEFGFMGTPTVAQLGCYVDLAML